MSFNIARCRGWGRWWAAVLGSLVLSQNVGHADEFDAAVKALLQSSYDNLQTATDCETVIGSSRYWQARGAVENALRAAGYSAATALLETTRMARQARRPDAGKSRTSVADCLADYTRTNKALLHHQDLLRARQR